VGFSGGRGTSGLYRGIQLGVLHLEYLWCMGVYIIPQTIFVRQLLFIVQQ